MSSGNGMDKTAWLALIVGMAVLVFYRPIVNHFYPPPPPSAQPSHTSPAASSTSAQAPAIPTPSNSQEIPSFRPRSVEVQKEPNLPEEKLLTLSNDFVTVEFTSHGGAVKRVILKKHLAEGRDPVVLNRGAEIPLLNLFGWDEEFAIAGYNVVEQTDQTITFARNIGKKLRLIRRYTLLENYSIQLTQTVENASSEPVELPAYWLQAGLGTSVYLKPTVRRYIGASWYTTEGKRRVHRLPEFDDGHFLFLWPTQGKAFVQSQNPVHWASATSQFFATILASQGEPATMVEVRKIQLTELHEEGGFIPDAVQAQMQMPGLNIPANGAVLQEFNFYAGPKKDALLRELPFEQNQVMEFGWLGFVSRPLLWVMNRINSIVHNYGLTIIILTILIKAALWIPQSRANDSMRKMQVLSPKLKELQDKYKDNPQRLQEEMMKLYQQYQVNPLGGCLPLLVQMPIFIGFYYMLLSAVELRHASFLWISDLSQPDTVAHLPLFGMEIPINPMPLIMGATMFGTMRLTPQPKGVDNPSLKFLKFMPAIILLICYNFSSALSLYWTVQNLLSGAQMFYNLKKPMPVLEPKQLPAGAPASAKKPKKSAGFFEMLQQAQKEREKQLKQLKKRKKR